VARTSREPGKAHGAQRPPNRCLVDRDAEFLEKPAREVLAPPAHHAMDGGDRSALHQSGQGLALLLVQLRPVARRFAVDQALRSVRVEAQHPVADHLDGDAADAGRLRL
jgi:hypothetical protein